MDFRKLTEYTTKIKYKFKEIDILCKSYPQQFFPFSKKINASKNSCVIGNGIPKSGTYLLSKLIEYLGQWNKINIHINPSHWDKLDMEKDDVVNECFSEYAVKKLRNGQFVGAHLPWSERLENSIKRSSKNRFIKHILIYRDPRNTFVSYMNFVTYSNSFVVSPSAREFRKFMLNKFSNDDDRLSFIIKRRRNYNFLEYVPWFKSLYCHSVKFEDLFRDIQNLNNGLGQHLTDLFNYLEVDCGSIDPTNLYENVYNKSRTASKEKNKIDPYKSVFKNEHYALLDNEEFKNILDTFGYE